MRSLFILITLLVHSFSCFGQLPATDSLLREVSKAKTDTAKIKLLNRVTVEFRNKGNYAEALRYSDKSIALARPLINSKDSLVSKSSKKGLAQAYNSVGVIQWYQGNYPSAINQFLSALKLFEELKFSKGMSACYNNLGLIYTDTRNNELAINYFSLAYKIYERLNNKPGMAAAYNNISLVYRHEKKFGLAIENNLKALEIRKAISDKNGIATSYNNLGLVYEQMGKYNEALKYQMASKSIYRETGDRQGLAGAYTNIGSLYISLKKYGLAKQYINEGLSLAFKVSSLEFIKESYAALNRLDTTINDYKSAKANHKLYVKYRDSIINEGNSNKILQAQMQYDFDKKESIEKAEQEKKDGVTAAQKQKRQVVLIIILCALILILVFSVFVFKTLYTARKQKRIIEQKSRETEAQKNTIEEKNKNILDSIYYARRIQVSLLPNENYIAKKLNELKK